MLGAIGAAPVTAWRRRPPNRLRTLTYRACSARSNAACSSAGTSSPRSCAWRTSIPTRVACSNSRASPADVASVWIFSKIRGTDGKNVGLSSIRLATIFCGSFSQ